MSTRNSTAKKSKPFVKGQFPNSEPKSSPHTSQAPDWRQIRDDLLNASQERTEAEIALIEAGQTRAAAEQAEQAAAQRLTAAQKRHEQARSRAGVAS